MKIRRGFVTNSSSTNDIFQALGTAAAAAVLGTIINVVKASKNTQIVSYALLETTHNPEEPRPPHVRVNDSSYTIWFFAAVRCIDVSITTDPESGVQTSTILKDEYDGDYTSQIKFTLPQDKIIQWLTFGSESSSTDGGMDYSSMQGDYKACGFMCESIYNDRPRRQRQAPPSSLIPISVSVNVGEKLLSTGKQCHVLDEADLYAHATTVINDRSIETKVLISVVNKGRYSWDLKLEPFNQEKADYCSYRIEDGPGTLNQDILHKYLIVSPIGKSLKTKEFPNATSETIRIRVTGKPSSNSIADVWDNLDINLVDEGLFFSGPTDTDGDLIIKAYINEPKETEMAPVQIDLSCVIKTDNPKSGSTATFIDMSKATLKISELQGTDDATKNLVKVFTAKIEPMTHPGTYSILPQMQLPASNMPYKVLLPISCSYEGESYDLELPIKLLGHPYGEKEKWEKEFQNLRIIIRKYIPAEEWDGILKQIEENKATMSSETLRLMRRSIYETARDNLVSKAEGYEQIATVLDWTAWGLEGVKWVGDQAFSYLMATYTGPVGEALIVPFKDIMTMLLAEMAGQFIFGSGSPYKEGELVRGALSQVFTSFENLLMMDGDKKVDSATLSVKQLGTYLAAFSAIKCCNHYFFDRKEDGSPIGFWDALIETCKDLTGNCMKILVTKKFEAVLQSEKAQKIFASYLSKQIKAYLINKFPDWEKNGFDIIGKYLSEFGGFVSTTAYGKVIEKAGQVEIASDATDTIISINLYNDETNPWIVKISLNKSKEALYNYIFDCIFGGFTFASAPIHASDDPVFYKA